MTDEEVVSPHAKINITDRPLRDDPDYVKCPRCWHYTQAGLFNYDHLCDRCVNTYLTHYPDEPQTPHIIAQRSKHIAELKVGVFKHWNG